MRVVCALALILLALPLTAVAQDGPDPSAAISADAPEIEPAALSILVRPLNVTQLENELARWEQLIQETDTELGLIQLQLRKISAIEAAEEAGQEPPASALVGPVVEGADPEQLAERAGELLAQRSALVERFEVVVADYASKGGDPEPHKQYARSVTDINVDWTDPVAAWGQVRAWAMSEEGGLALAQRVGIFAAVIIAAYLAGVILSWIFAAFFRVAGTGSKLLRRFIVRWSRRVIFIIGALIGLSALGIDVTPLVAALGAAGFVIGFALQNTLSNFASGLLIMTQHPFDVGDAITAAGVTGTVDRVTLFSTHITTFDNSKLIVPNNSVWSSVITNSTAADTKRLDLTFDVKGDVTVEQAEQTMIEALKEHPKVLREPVPVVRMDELTEDGFKLICWPWTKTTDAGEVRWDITRAAKERLRADVSETAEAA